VGQRILRRLSKFGPRRDPLLIRITRLFTPKTRCVILGHMSGIHRLRVRCRLSHLAFAIMAATLVLASPAGAAAPGSPTPRARWTQFGFDAEKTSYNPSETTLGVTDVGGLTKAWTTKVWLGVNRSGIFSPPSVARGIVYAASDDERLYAVRARDGKRIYPNTPPGIDACDGGYSPAIDHREVVVAMGQCTETGGGRVAIYDRSSGAAVTGLGAGQHNAATIAGGAAFVWEDSGDIADSPPYLISFDPASGATLWSQTLSDGSGTAPAVANGIVYETTAGHVLTFDETTGTPGWSVPEALGYGGSTVVGDGLVFASGMNGVVALDATDGSAVWSAVGIGGTLAFAGSVLYVGGEGGLYALNASTGVVLWHRPPAVSAPVVANGVVYAGGYRLRAFDISDGQILWHSGSRKNTPFPYRYSSPVIVNGAVFAGRHARLIAWRVSG
jgi:outer membrane protein assembly factor BamB